MATTMTISRNKRQRQLLFEIAIILIIKVIFLYIIWSIVFSQRDPNIRTTQAMANHLIYARQVQE